MAPNVLIATTLPVARAPVCVCVCVCAIFFLVATLVLVS